MKSELRREQILRAATRVFAEKGYHRASITDIIEKSGIARGTFYLYFEGKREIFSELVDVLLARLQNCMKRVDLAKGNPPWIEQIRANIVRIANVLLEEKEMTIILYNHAMGLDEDFDLKIRHFYEELRGRAEGAVALGQEMGLLKKDMNPWLVALHLVGSVKEVMFNVAARDEFEMSVEQLADELMLYSTSGLVAAPPKKTK